MSGPAETMTAEQLVERSFTEWDCNYVVEISPTRSNDRMRGINPELNKARFYLYDHESAPELTVRNGVPHARLNYALMFRGEPLELDGSAVTAVNVKGRWERPLGQRQMTMTTTQFVVGRKCSCGNKGRALIADGRTLCRKCLPAELDERLTPAVRAARIIDNATASHYDRLTATDLVVYAAHQVITEHGYLSVSDAYDLEDRQATSELVSELCQQLLGGAERPDNKLLGQAPFLRQEALELAAASSDDDLNGVVPMLESDVVTARFLPNVAWAYGKLLASKALGGLASLSCDPGYLGAPGDRINLEVSVDCLKEKSVVALSDQGHLLTFPNPGIEIVEEGRYRITATVEQHTSSGGLSVTELGSVEITEDLCALV